MQEKKKENTNVATRLVKRMEKTLENKIKNSRTYKTPTAPGQIILRTTEKDEIVNKETLKQVRSRVQKCFTLLSSQDLIFLMQSEKLQRLWMDQPKFVKSFYRIVKYVIDIKNIIDY
jgi:hypothetical protein